MMSDESKRAAYFAGTRRVLRDYYLADPHNPHQQSGRSSGAARWEETRRCSPTAYIAAARISTLAAPTGCSSSRCLSGWGSVGSRSSRPVWTSSVSSLISHGSGFPMASSGSPLRGIDSHPGGSPLSEPISSTCFPTIGRPLSVASTDGSSQAAHRGLLPGPWRPRGRCPRLDRMHRVRAGRSRK